MIFLLVAAITGGVTTAIVASMSFGVLTGILLAPLGGSALTLVAGLFLALRRDVATSMTDVEDQVTEQVGALRALLEGKPVRSAAESEEADSKAA